MEDGVVLRVLARDPVRWLDLALHQAVRVRARDVWVDAQMEESRGRPDMDVPVAVGGDLRVDVINDPLEDDAVR